MDEISVCHDCINRTGGCCTNVNLILSKSEIKPFLETKQQGQFSESDSLEKWDSGGELYTYNSGEKKCIFLTEKKTCLIYETRPIICKLYPIVWKKGLIESFETFIDLLCPLTHAKPIIEMYKPTQENNTKKLMKEIGSLEFDQEDCSYLNITDKKRSSEALHDLYEE